jgi:hypothetical protein
MAIFCCTGFSSGKGLKWVHRIKTAWSCVLGLAIISIIFNVLFLGQQNEVELALMLPIAAASSWLPELIINRGLGKRGSRRGAEAQRGIRN